MRKKVASASAETTLCCLELALNSLGGSDSHGDGHSDCLKRLAPATAEITKMTTEIKMAPLDTSQK